MFSTHSMKYIWYSPKKRKFIVEHKPSKSTKRPDQRQYRHYIHLNMDMKKYHRIGLYRLLHFRASCGCPVLHTNNQAWYHTHEIFSFTKTKTQISCAVIAQLIRAFVFATRVVKFLLCLQPKFQDSSFHPWMYRQVCFGPGRKSRSSYFVFKQIFFKTLVVESRTPKKRT